MGWLSSLFQGLGNAVGGAGKSLMGAASSAQNFLNPIVGAGMNLAQNAGKSFGNNIMNSFSPKSQAPAISMAKSAPMAQQASQAASPASSGFGSLNLNNLGLKSSPIFKNMMNMNYSTPSMPGQVSTAVKPQGNDWFSQLTKGINLPQMAAGAGINLAGNMFAPKVNVPNIKDSSNYQALQNFKGGKLPPDVEDMIRRNHAKLADEEQRKMDALYHSARPGTDLLTDSSYIRDNTNLHAGLEERLMDDLAKAGMQYSGQEQDRLSSLANADVAQIMLETGMSAQEAEQFKNSFSNIGSMLMQNAMPQQYGMDWLAKLFGGQS